MELKHVVVLGLMSAGKTGTGRRVAERPGRPVAAGDVAPEHTHMLSTGGMLAHARESDADTFIVATETGMIPPLAEENPGKSFIPANRAAVCAYMKMITLPKVRDALRDGGERYEVRVPPEVAERARVPIERMVAIGA